MELMKTGIELGLATGTALLIVVGFVAVILRILIWLDGLEISSKKKR